MADNELNRDGKQAPSGGEKQKDAQGHPVSPLRGLVIWILLFVGVLTIFQVWTRAKQGREDIPYHPDFIDFVKEKRVGDCEIVSEVSGRMHVRCDIMGVEGAATGQSMKVRVNINEGDEVQALLRENEVRYKNVQPSPLIWDLLSGIVPVLFLFAILYFLFIRQMRSAGHGVMGFGRSRAKLLSRDRNRITFENVGGIDEAKEEVQEIIAFLKDPKRFQKLGGRIPKGVLLMGPPGTGKTLLAKAIAGQAEVPFFSISGSDFVEMFVGVGASRVRDMFEQGKKNAPCLIFIDEIDAVGRSRFSGIGGGHDEREQTLNALLVEMDGFETSEGVIIIAATNRPDVLDPALLRPGRFDRQIVIDLPMLDGREAILKMHAKKIKIGEDVEFRGIARGTPGFSGADLETLLNEAALVAAKMGKVAVEMTDLEEARDKVRWGRERRSRVLDENEKKITAHHEAGHAIVGLNVEESEPLHKITIIPRGSSYLGATMQLPEKDRFIEGKMKLKGILASCMGGRVAEEIVFGDISSGASSDLKEATRIARLMVCSWGMSETLGPQTFGQNDELMFLGREVTRKQDYSENTATRIDEEVSDLLKEAYQRAKDILTRKRETMELLAGFLIERETLDATDVAEITEFGRILSESERAERKMEKERDGKAEQTEQAQESVVRDGVAGPVAEDCPAGDQ
jgi:cell division protease FtsH